MEHKGGGALECCVVRFISRARGGRAPSHQALVVDDSRARAEGSHEVFKYCAGYARLPDHAGSMKRAAGSPKPDQPNDNFFTALVGVVSVGAGSHLLEWGMRSCDELERQHESTLRDGLEVFMLTVFCIEKLVHRGKGRVGMHAVVGAAVPVIAWDTCFEQSMCVQVAGGCVQRAKADAVAQKDQVDHHVTLVVLDRRARCTSEIIVGAMTAAE